MTQIAYEVVCSLYSRTVRGTWDGFESTPNIRKWSTLAKFAAVGSPANPKLYREKGFNMRRVPAGGSAEGLFRGWVYPWILSGCRRHALQLRNGGTYRTTRPENRPAQVVSLGAMVDTLAEESVLESERLGAMFDTVAVCRPSIPATMDAIDAVPHGRRLARGSRRAS
jgi:hypothetical protein